MGFSLFGKNKQSASDTDTDEMEGKAPPRRRKKNAEQPVDPVLPEKKRARRRLVGAAAMVLAAIIGLPMLLESEPQPLTDDVQIYIPSIEKTPVKIEVAQNDEARQPEKLADVQEPPEQSKPAAPVEAMPAAKPAVVASTTPVTKPADTTKTTKPSAVTKEATPVPVAAAKSETPKSSTQASANSTERERAAQVQALLEGRSTSVAPAEKSGSAPKQDGKFALQVAALGSADKAKELQEKLSKAGIKSYTEKVKVAGGEQIRVRVGPFASRDEADKMRGKLSDIGLNGMVMPL